MFLSRVDVKELVDSLTVTYDAETFSQFSGKKDLIAKPIKRVESMSL